MAAVVIKNSRRAEEAPVAPIKANGTKYQFELIFDGGNKRAYADETGDLVAELIPGYVTQRERIRKAGADQAAQEEAIGEAYFERLKYAAGIQVQLQAALLAEYEDDATVLITEEERAILLAPRDVPPSPKMWDCVVPLVLLEDFYQPLGKLPLPDAYPRSGNEPGSNLILLSTQTEEALLRSLHNAGIVNLAELNSTQAK